jgi:MFS transporter, putative metabolite:H+ symporter
MTKEIPFAIAARLERLPFSRFHRRLLLMGGLGYSFDAMDSAVLAFALPALMGQWSLSSINVGLLGSATYIGYFFGAFAAGIAGDLIGRRAVMMWALAIYAIASLVSAAATSAMTFFILRVLAGIGVGAESVIVAPFLCEFVATPYRGRFVGALTGFFSLGFLAAATLGYALVPLATWGWRASIALTAAPIALLLWWRRALPESPRWLESRGRHAQADAVLSQIEAQILSTHGRGLPEPVPSGPFVASDDRVSVRINLAALISKPLIRVTLMSWTVWLSITFAYYSFFTWIPTLLMDSGMTLTKSFGYSIAIYAAQLPGFYSAAHLNDRIGRRATIVSYVALAGVAAFLLAIARSNVWIVSTGACLSLFMNGAYAGVYAYTAEVFPTVIRTTGVGVASAIGRLGAIGGPILVGALFPKWGFAGVFGLTAAVLCAGALAVMVLGVRTHGRSLEAIATSENPLHFPLVRSTACNLPSCAPAE